MLWVMTEGMLMFYRGIAVTKSVMWILTEGVLWVVTEGMLWVMTEGMNAVGFDRGYECCGF